MYSQESLRYLPAAQEQMSSYIIVKIADFCVPETYLFIYVTGSLATKLPLLLRICPL